MSNVCSLSTKATEICSPIGIFTIHCCEMGIHKVSMDPTNTDENFIPNESCSVNIVKDEYSGEKCPVPVKECLKWMKSYFEDVSSTRTNPHLCPLDDDKKFQPKVWRQILENVPAGETITYKNLAASLNNPGAARAVGTAMKNNPVCIIVPCHRVVRTDGMGLYRGGQGQKVKKWLLEHEGHNFE